MAYIFAGLGNPGASYEQSRHNAGFMALDAFRRAYGFSEWTDDARSALVARGEIAGEEVTLVKPQTFMNRSGEAVMRFVHSPEEAARSLVVVHDELDIPLGSLKVSFDRSAGGHNGVQSVIDMLGTQAFARVRIGVGRNEGAPIENPRSFVLARFTDDEKEPLADILTRAVRALHLIATTGREKAANEVNG